MLHLLIHLSNHKDFDRGYTVVEIMVILVIVGILCAIAAPSLLAMQGIAKLNSSADNIRTALEASQFQSIQRKTSCKVYIPNNSNQITNDCLSLVNLDSGITVTTTGITGSPAQVIYNKNGLTQSNGTIIVSSNETGDKRCLEIKAGVGLIRSGKYIGIDCQITE